MKINEYLSKIFNTYIIATKSDLGLTNDIYFFKYKNTKMVANVPKDHLSTLIRGKKYYKVLKEIKKIKIDVPEIYYDKKTHVRITKYIKSDDYNSSKDDKKHLKVARMLKKLHSKKIKVNESFNCFKEFKNYQSKIKKPLLDYSFFDDIFKIIKKFKNEKVLCHNDIVSGNVLFSKNRAYLIDWEYAKENDPLFDLMSFITENNIEDIKIRQEFLKAYFGNKINDKIKFQLKIYEIIHNVLWACWANMMYDQRKNEDYLKIFINKIEALKKCLRR